jgi:predicted enzyme related to lactoylglutathione lyase
VLTHGGVIALPKMPVPGVGWLAYCKDIDGHVFGVLQPDASAA